MDPFLERCETWLLTDWRFNDSLVTMKQHDDFAFNRMLIDRQSAIGSFKGPFAIKYWDTVLLEASGRGQEVAELAVSLGRTVRLLQRPSLLDLRATMSNNSAPAENTFRHWRTKAKKLNLPWSHPRSGESPDFYRARVKAWFDYGTKYKFLRMRAVSVGFVSVVGKYESEDDAVLAQLADSRASEVSIVEIW